MLIHENGGGPGVRWQKRQQKKGAARPQTVREGAPLQVADASGVIGKATLMRTGARCLGFSTPAEGPKATIGLNIKCELSERLFDHVD
jgi:hypothetical protein